MGESTNSRAKLRFDRRIRLEFHGATITSDAGLLACRELDDALGLTETASECLQEKCFGQRHGDSGRRGYRSQPGHQRGRAGPCQCASVGAERGSGNRAVQECAGIR